MTEDIAISAQNLSKMYLLYNKPVDRLKQSIMGRFGKNYARTFWALRDVTFSITRGKTYGIVGRNGSGKSTLLQILAGTLQPTSGNYSIKGRLAALLELGAGFNVEFTGRENIFLNGATLGISEKEMHRREDEIIDFAQIGEFIDQPVKFYSSGMFIRLAFAIATAMNPDILLVDEALAVGDAGFVIKCMNRMKQMREQGSTIILVTHDVQTVRSFCDEAMWLHEGRTEAIGTPVDVTSRYLQFLFEGQSVSDKTQSSPRLSYDNLTVPERRSTILINDQKDLVRWGSGELQIESFAIDNGLDIKPAVFENGTPIHIEMTVTAKEKISSTEVGFGFSFRNTKGLDIITGTTLEQGIRIPPLSAGQTIHLSFDLENILAPGNYALVLNAERRDQGQPQYYDFIENAIILSVINKTPIFSLVLPKINCDVQIY